MIKKKTNNKTKRNITRFDNLNLFTYFRSISSFWLFDNLRISCHCCHCCHWCCCSARTFFLLPQNAFLYNLFLPLPLLFPFSFHYFHFNRIESFLAERYSHAKIPEELQLSTKKIEYEQKIQLFYHSISFHSLQFKSFFSQALKKFGLTQFFFSFFFSGKVRFD